MFGATTLAAYFVVTVVVTVSPGPDAAYVLARGAGEGPGAGVRSALGVATGVLVHTVAAAVGLAALSRAVPAARPVVVSAAPSTSRLSASAGSTGRPPRPATSTAAPTSRD